MNNPNPTLCVSHPVAPSTQRGVSLIEVLISIVVLSVGMLGVAAILMMSLRNSHGAMEHSQAVVQSYGMLETLRANKSQAIIGGYNMPSWTCTRPSNDNRIGAELADWITTLQSEVSASACGRIVCNSLSCEVAIRWNDERATGGSAAKTYVLTTRL